ncbi:DNA-dependent metalloprotease WSS1 [Andrographis paniculata]|uniref:DNA-dependent metalloprotease WSS1 n=1 Tax=Andrographis paniculata TaxID=175694 RepID=UPI0021E9A8C3|nr:DNA-dependent metalloprotease WSS1 [Andrographis paniculata]XP_051133560.1 DNA-dependent metalloprotease WSS1 [Andrographis paniculata]XP_051133561.1 DNA-dependent metalloprotease WSS1 [Andrographis paniculata]
MNLGDLNKVWEIKSLKRKPNEEEARKILERIAKQVQPIMRKHNWRVKVLSEFCPKNPALLGLNVGRGIHVKLRLRRANRDDEFIPFHQVLDTMLHELCHNAHGPHNAVFYKLWDEIRKECEDLINRGISGSGEGFDIPGRRLGGASRKPLSSLRQAASKAAENRARLGSLMPSGPKKIGGDSSIMAALSPVQAAAMAAERRLQDEIWCGSEFYNLSEEDESLDKVDLSTTASTSLDEDNTKQKSRKRGREVDDVSLRQSTFVDLTETVPNSSSFNRSNKESLSQNNKNKLPGEASSSSSKSSHDPTCNDHCSQWECTVCTLLNPPLAPICDLCRSERPKENNLKTGTWSCRFCTLENDRKIDKCAVCGSWRYSYGPPLASSAPNRGT